MSDVEDEPTLGFFRRNRALRLIVGIAITAILIAAYLFGIASYRSGLASSLPTQTPPAQGLSVVIVPDSVEATDQIVPAQVLVFPSADLVDTNGLLTKEIEIRVQPALSGQVLALPAGEAPAPQRIDLPAPGIVQEYPFDSYTLSTKVSAQAVFADAYDPIVVDASLFLRMPGWSGEGISSSAHGTASTVAATLDRDGSTKSIALLLLLLMVILATIAILVTGAATRGRMKLELSVASWMTALLFALLPIRGFFPGSPPLGSWMDVLVFFWVELILMVAVAAVVTTILLRARDVRRHPEEQS